MALGTIGTALAVSAATTGGSMLASKFLGGGKNPTAPLQQFAPPGINAGGLSATFGGGNYNVTSSAERKGLVGDIAATFGDNADAIAALRAQVAPGVSGLRASRLAEIEGARSSAIGNLRDNLARRRVLGSSFGADTISRAEAEFAKEKERVAAESFMQELELTNNLVQQEFTARRGAYQTGLDELNLEAQVATALAGKATDILGKNAQIEAQLLAQSQAGAGKFFGQEIAPNIKSAVTALAGMNFGGGGAPGGFGAGTFNASGAI
jgi:hypothetical protein